MNIENQEQIEMPRYRCHKEVWALKIAAIEIKQDGSAEIVPHDAAFNLFIAPKEWAERFHGAKEDDPGYYVVYEGGYTSWSPTAAFESGYTPI